MKAIAASLFKSFVVAGVLTLCLSMCRAQVPIADPVVGSVSNPLIDQNALGSAPAPSLEITPGASDLTQSPRKLAPVDPLNSRLESTTASADVNAAPDSSPPDQVDTYIRDSTLTGYSMPGLDAFRGSETSAAFSGRAPLSTFLGMPEPQGPGQGAESADLSSAGPQDEKSNWRAASRPPGTPMMTEQVSPAEQAAETQSATASVIAASSTATPSAEAAQSFDPSLGIVQTPGKPVTSSAQVQPVIAVGVAAAPDSLLFGSWSASQEGSPLVWQLEQAGGADAFRDLQTSSFLVPSILGASSPPSQYSAFQDPSRAARSTLNFSPEQRLHLNQSIHQRRSGSRRRDSNGPRPVYHNKLLEQMQSNSDSDSQQ